MIPRIVRRCACLALLSLVAAVLLPVWGCDRKSTIWEPGTPSLTVVPQSVNLAVGSLGSASAIISGGEAGMDRSIIWEVADTTIAQVTYVSANGATVIGRAPGTTSLIATVAAGPTARAAAVVVVR